MKSEFILTKTDLKKSVSINFMQNKLKIYIGLIICVWIYGYIVFNRNLTSMIYFDLALTLWALLTGFLTFKYTQYVVGKSFDENDEYGSKMSVEIINDEMVLVTDKSTSSIPAKRILKVIFSKEYCLAYRSRIMYHIIPISVVNENNEIRNWLFANKNNKNAKANKSIHRTAE